MTSALQQAVQEAAKKAKPGVSGWQLMADIGPFAAIANLPLAIGLSVVGVAGSAIAEHKNLSEAKMPDEWLGQVAEASDVSMQGLAFLAKRLAENGFVSVQDAMEWIGIEEAEAKKRSVANAETQPGASSLLERAKKECGALLEPSVYDHAMRALKLVSKAAPDILASVGRFVGEKGKGK